MTDEPIDLELESLAGVKRDIARHAQQWAHVEVRLDQVRERLDVIGRRVDPADAWKLLIGQS